MRYRTLGRTGWQVSEPGYGMGQGDWSGPDDAESLRSLQLRQRVTSVRRVIRDE